MTSVGHAVTSRFQKRKMRRKSAIVRSFNNKESVAQLMLYGQTLCFYFTTNYTKRGCVYLNCTPKVFCLTFGVQFILTQPFLIIKISY